MFLLKKLIRLIYVQIVQSIDLIETYGCGTSKDRVSEKEEIKWRNIIIRYKK